MKNAQLYRRWLDDHGLADLRIQETKRGRVVQVQLPTPDERYLFPRKALTCLLPYFRVYWKAEARAGRNTVDPIWRPETWERVGDGFARFMRADQALDCLRAMHPNGDDAPALVRAIRMALGAWLVPLDDPMKDRRHIIDRRIEAIRLRVHEGRISWTRNARFFPDDLRASVLDGIDPVHTPENARAGLTRYLCEGWAIDDDGRLTSAPGATGWGPSVARIPYRLHDAPRRLMLGASLQARSVSLVETDRPLEPGGDLPDLPHGRTLWASFSTFGGWTHEDAIVLAESAARRLARREVRRVRVLVPSVAARVALEVDVTDRPVAVQHGQRLARAWLDAFALGLRRHDAEELGADDGWIELALPGASAPIDGEVRRVARQAVRSPRSREVITFEIERTPPVRVGDKLSTRHGIKGVVSRILPDDDMPLAGERRAEIILSPLGILRRGAMGQFREAASSAAATELPRAGAIFVMRQPQDADAPERCRARGPERRAHKQTHHGQRYGEMEFWALMAHGAEKIAAELLSLQRSTASWVDWETRIDPGEHRKLATRALNRYLAVAGLKIVDGRLAAGKQPTGVFDIEPKWSGHGDARDKLEDAEYFCERGGLGRLDLGRKVRVALGGEGDGSALEIDHIFVIPPWLRPASPDGPHPLSRAYWRLMAKLAWFRAKPDEIDRAVGQCVRLVLDEDKGAGGFLRREVLGRRLTRSARAVIVPRPDLHIDQIAIPDWMAARLFEGLPDANRRLVLVNRNPTLHRRGLLALRPVIDPSNSSHVFGVPLGILRALGADFDGDQMNVVVLETDAALTEAEQLLPGAAGLRSDPFRRGKPAFPLCGELADAAAEEALAGDGASTQEVWCEAHWKLQNARLDQLGDGWKHPLVAKAIADNAPLWNSLAEAAWRSLATTEMETLLRGVRRKGRLGGVLRRELYRRPYSDNASFWRTVQALQAVTERMTQTALSVKSGGGATGFESRSYFADPEAGRTRLAALDESAGKTGEPLDGNRIAEELAQPMEPNGLLAWMATPYPGSITTSLSGGFRQAGGSDPRIHWFLT